MKKTPDLKVKTLENEPINLTEKYSGQNVLVLFYNNDCLGCTGRAIPLAYDIMQEFNKLEVIAVHSNFSRTFSTSELLSIFTAKESPFPIYVDEEHKVYDLLKCEGTPHWIILNKEGEIYKSFFGSQANAQTRLWYALNELIQLD